MSAHSTLLHLYKWLIAVPFLGISTILIGVPLILLSLLGFGDFGSRTLAALWARLNSQVLGMAVNIEGLEYLDSDRSYVVTANHWSQLDILLIYGYLPIELKWVMKQELRKVPIVGAACAAMGHIIIDRSDSAQAVKSIQKAGKKTRQWHVCDFFPRRNPSTAR